MTRPALRLPCVHTVIVEAVQRLFRPLDSGTGKI